MSTAKQTHAFNTEVKALLQLMIHALYSNKEIFLRELISNASDALDKLRFEALQNAQIHPEGAARIKVGFDKESRTLFIEDNGIGMSENEAIENLGTIAKSGTKAFLEKLSGDQAKDAALIGQFGVGFYSAFMVADKVTVETRRADLPENAGLIWESTGEGEYTLSKCNKKTAGTRITLHLKAEEDEWLSHWKLREVIMKYSDHIAFPVEMQKEEENEENSTKEPEFEAVNKATALWARPKSQVTEEEYRSFYQHVSHDFQEPLAWTHNRVEGKIEYTNLLYIPKRAPFDLFQAQAKHRGVKLYVKRVFIMDDAEQFMPTYLRFVKGVIDCPDLPLNVSREILQHNKTVDTIRTGSVKKILGLLEDLSKNHPEQYLAFWTEFGTVMKEGPIEDVANQAQLAQLLRFATTFKDEKAQTQSLADYVARMKEGQTKIYYVTAETFGAAKNSPHLEIFRKKGIEVLLLSDRIDEWLMSHLREFEGKPLESVAKGDLNLGDLGAENEAADVQEDESFKDLIAAFQLALGNSVKAIRLTQRLTDSPACVVVESNDMGLQLQRIFKAAGQAVPNSQPILELNPHHPLLKRLNQNVADPKTAEWAHLLFEQSILAEGGQLEDPAAFVKRMNLLIG